jgi:hypothetical protein
MYSAGVHVSPALSAGLTAAGVDPNAARVLGQVGNLVVPIAAERGIPAAADAFESGLNRLLSREGQALTQSAVDTSGQIGQQALRGLTDYVSEGLNRTPDAVGADVSRAPTAVDDTVAPLYTDSPIVDEHGVPTIPPASADALRQSAFVNPRLAASLGGGALGGYAGWQSDPNAPLPERMGVRRRGCAGRGRCWRWTGLWDRSLARDLRDTRLRRTPGRES